VLTMREYSNIIPIRFTDEDLTQANEIANKLKTPRSTLIRQAWREWLKLQSIEKTAN